MSANPVSAVESSSLFKSSHGLGATSLEQENTKAKKAERMTSFLMKMHFVIRCLEG